MSYLSDWAEQVINRDRNCVVCGSKKNLEAHHVFKVNMYDDAYLDLNNGITLCHSCHEKYHSRYGLDCNIKNLLNFKSEIKDPSHEKLIKNHSKVCNELGILSKKYNTLIKKHESTCSQNKDLEEKNRKLKKKNKKLKRKITKAYVNAFM